HRRSDITQTYPWVVAFSFGLLHGLGFDGALAEIGLPHGEIPLALFSFNVGVELGQLAFIAAVLSTGYLTRILLPHAPSWARAPPPTRLDVRPRIGPSRASQLPECAIVEG